MEFDYKKEYGPIIGTFYEKGILPGRIIGWSKSGYMKKYPNNEVYFNANIFVFGEGKVWFGDLDLTLDKPMLEEISKEIGKKLYIVKEMDGRFENEDIDDDKIIKYAVSRIG